MTRDDYTKVALPDHADVAHATEARGRTAQHDGGRPQAPAASANALSSATTESGSSAE